MIDLKVLRQSPNTIQETLDNRFIKLDLNTIKVLDANILQTKQKTEELKQQRNKAAVLLSDKTIKGEERETAILENRNLGQKIKQLDDEIRNLEEQRNKQISFIPNFLDSETPLGKSEQSNKEIHKFGTPPTFNFPPRRHYEIAEKLNILDIPRGVKLAKSRFAILKNKGAMLERAIAQFMLDLHLSEHGYQELSVPFLVNSNCLYNTSQLPKFADDLFQTTDGLFLIPTAEVPLTNIYKDEILAEENLPLQFVAHTPCFRSEAGSYGKDTKGLIRQHQFSKVELVWLTHPEKSEEAHQKLLAHAETVLKKLELPYRTVLLCSGDIGFAAAKCYDIEVWLPGENHYREISSCSNCWDFQARRGNLKYYPKGGGKARFLHTLNGSGLAVGRTWIAIVENYQQEDGSIKIPKILQPYMKGLTKIS